MRELTAHKVNPANDKLSVLVLDPAGAGGAHHLYLIEGFVATENNNPALNYHPSGGPGTLTGASLLFQNGAINEVGVNGITHEALLAVLIDRLECFQDGPYANHYNEDALHSLQEAMYHLHKRTQDRMKQGIEGTMAVGAETTGRVSSPEQVVERAGANGPADAHAGPPGDPVHKGKKTDGNPIMRYFAFQHLPQGPLRDTSAQVSTLADILDQSLPAGAEKSAGMRKLLEAKDCFVRAALP